MTAILERWHHHEDDVRGIAGHRDRIVHAGSGIVITAPHAVPHMRSGDVKRADMWTGGLALLLAELTGAGVVVETSGVGDPSWEAHAFKDALGSLDPQVVIDLHAMRATHSVVELGTGAPQGNPPSRVAVALRCELDDAGIATLVDHRFPARGHATLVQWALRRGVEAVQVELSVRLTPPFVAGGDAEALVAALADTITSLTHQGIDPAR